MRKTLVLARRELAGCFISPIAYVIVALYVAFGAVIFFFEVNLFSLTIRPVFVPGGEASLRDLFEALAWAMVVAAPLLTMRLVADEVRSGTIETLMTAPVTDTQVILGKFFGVLAFYVVLLASTLVFLAILCVYSRPDMGVAVTGYAGMLLLGACFLSVGVFASTLSRYQLVGGLVGIAILGGFLGLLSLLMQKGEPWNYMASSMNAMTYFKEFARGVFDTRGLAFFVSVTAAFLFLSVKTLESRRWR